MAAKKRMVTTQTMRGDGTVIYSLDLRRTEEETKAIE
jgi:hypothetical protein